MSKHKLDLCWFVGVLLPIPIFLDPTSNIILAQSRLAEGGTAFPISMFILPLLLLYVFLSKERLKFDEPALAISLLILAFTVWVLALGFISSLESLTSILYSIQWVLPLIWFFFFYKCFTQRGDLGFSKGFEIGAVFSFCFIFFAGCFEMLSYGGLLDAGRLTQNLVFKGQYQLYVYTPTIIAYSVLFLNWLYISKVISRSRLFVIMINLLAMLAILFLGAREAMVVFIFGIVFIYLSKKSKYLFLYFLFLCFLFFVFFVFSTEIFSLLKLDDVRLISKFKDISEDGKGLGARDIMVLKYIEIIKLDPVFGLQMMPPQIAYPELAIMAPSAHNFYVDVWAWSGFPGAMLYYALVIFILIISVRTIYSFYLRGGADYLNDSERVMLGLAYLLLSFLLVSNNINVPLRQPLTGPLFIMFLAFLLARRKQC